MAWDLRAALLRKEEFETARLIDFEFRQRARTFKLMAAALGAAADELLGFVVLEDDQAILRRLAQSQQRTMPELQSLHEACRARARRQLIDEVGDPTPIRLG